MAAERLTDEELAALEEKIKGRGPEAWALAWSKLGGLVAELREARALLEEIEWGSGREANQCPICRWKDPGWPKNSHGPGCRFGAALGRKGDLH